jgi:hypothetical protein
MSKPRQDKDGRLEKGVFPISAPARHADEERSDDEAPDLRIEEIEEKQIPKDRNIFDK